MPSKSNAESAPRGHAPERTAPRFMIASMPDSISKSGCSQRRWWKLCFTDARGRCTQTNLKLWELPTTCFYRKQSASTGIVAGDTRVFLTKVCSRPSASRQFGSRGPLYGKVVHASRSAPCSDGWPHKKPGGPPKHWGNRLQEKLRALGAISRKRGPKKSSAYGLEVKDAPDSVAAAENVNRLASGDRERASYVEEARRRGDLQTTRQPPHNNSSHSF